MKIIAHTCNGKSHQERKIEQVYGILIMAFTKDQMYLKTENGRNCKNKFDKQKSEWGWFEHTWKCFEGDIFGRTRQDHYAKLMKVDLKEQKKNNSSVKTVYLANQVTFSLKHNYTTRVNV